MIEMDSDVIVHLDGLDPRVQMWMNAPPILVRMVDPVWMETIPSLADVWKTSEAQPVYSVSILVRSFKAQMVNLTCPKSRVISKAMSRSRPNIFIKSHLDLLKLMKKIDSLN